MVGDRLATDIAFGLNNDILSVMVLTGEATMEDVETVLLSRILFYRMLRKFCNILVNNG